MVLPPLKYISIPCFLKMFLQLSHHIFNIGYNYVRLVAVTACVVLVVARNLVSSIVVPLFYVCPI